ncbi:glycosyltransferase family 4 protein [Herminiimonas aquatilis]|uniref:Glycosyltransferase family 4 protein n=1 Tax=Herminiimonas aquatilis TaxID=345342 RepID=A0ABW2JAT5_9BURK
MNLLILNTFDSQGGAAIATFRLHSGLRSIGVSSHMLVQGKKTDDRSVIGPSTKWQKVVAILRLHLDSLLAALYRKREKVLFSSAWIPENLFSKVEKFHPDIVHLFWVNSGFLKIETLRKFKQPIVWTLHDMWPFTGGCHYDDECGKFRQSCGDCPLLHSDKDSDLSRRIWTRKQAAWSEVPMVIVATSHWLADMARSSSLFKNQRIEVIPNGIDIERYKPIDKKTARSAYNLPQEKHLILFSAFSATSDKRKGNQFLILALEKIAREGWGAKTELIIIGASEPENSPDLGMKVHYIRQLHDEISQVLLYSAADVVVAPSMQENLSNTVMESLACGTPVVAFDIGGMPDMIDHQISGYLATPFESNDLADGIMWVLEDKNRRDMLSQRARQTAEERYALQTVAHRYCTLYQSILK